jgi:hypothetical protein
MRNQPPWWDWELELSSHLYKRMLVRGFNEIDVCHMLHSATRVWPDIIAGRWVVDTRLQRKRWQVIVEPDHHAQLVVVVTAYPVDS